MRDEEIKKLNSKLHKLEKYKIELQDKDAEISVLSTHLDEMNSSHSYAMEKVQTLSRELTKEKNLTKKIQQNFYELNDPEEANRSIDFSSERGNLMDQSDIMGEHPHIEEDQNLTLEDELGMLGLEEDTDAIFENTNDAYALDIEEGKNFAEISPEAPFPLLEEQKLSPSLENPPVKNLTKKFESPNSKGKSENPDLETQNLKYSDYMADFIKADKKRKEFEVYLKNKKRQKRRKLKNALMIALPILVFLIIMYFLIS